jgi:hypothetical protein
LELLFNLLWITLSVALFGMWLRGQLQWADGSLRPSAQMQIAALAVLIIVLLPVVSLTDDLQACTAPAEAEHLVRRDLHDSSIEHIDASSIIIAVLFSFQNASGLTTLSHLPTSLKIGAPRENLLSIVGIRPPPHA